MEGYVPCPVLPDRYLINTEGRIYSLRSNRKEKHIAQRIDRYGYPRVNLYKGTKNHTVTIHRLLALAFISNDEPGIKTEVNHIDGNKLNNKLDNLEWVTASQNIQHSYRTGLSKGKKGESNPRATYNESNVRDVCERLLLKERNGDIHKETGYSFSFIEKVKYGETWTHISQEYGIIPKLKRATTIQSRC